MKQYLVFTNSPPEGALEVIGAVCVEDVAAEYENDDGEQVAVLGTWEELSQTVKDAVLQQVYETWQNNDAITDALWDHVYKLIPGATDL